MKNSLITPLIIVCAFTLPASSQDGVENEAESVPVEITTGSGTRITDQVSSDILTVVHQKPVAIDFEVIQSVTGRVLVEESPEMAGIPAPVGMINLTVELVRQPELSDPPPLPALEPEDPAVVARMGELAKEHPDTQLVFVSASVYKQSITEFRIQASGTRAKEITGWSNIDFHHFSGFANYQVQGPDDVVRSYGLIMGIGDMISSDPNVTIPKLPDLATQGPAFILTGGDIHDRETKELIEGIHSLYKAEGQRLAQVYRERTEVLEQRKASLLANPPKPKDVTIRFWTRDNSNPR